jgi:hypothetical protein
MVFTPIVTNRAFRSAASYRSRGGRAKVGYGNVGERQAMGWRVREGSAGHGPMEMI